MPQIIDGKKIAEKIKDEIVKKIVKLNGERPNLAMILIGEREDSKLYVNLKEREAKKVGIETHTYKCEKNVREEDVLETIEYLNNDKLIDAILVQLPLPPQFDTDKIIKAIDPAKDVDRFHPANTKILLSTCNHDHIMPPLFSVILAIFSNINYDIADKNICLISNSDIFSKNLEKVLQCRQAQVVTCKYGDDDLAEKTKLADCLISAVGKPKFIKKDMVKKEAVIIDIGICKDNDKLCGDVDFDDVTDVAGFITPVPGGVGPITIAMLFKNTLDLFEDNRKK